MPCPVLTSARRVGFIRRVSSGLSRSSRNLTAGRDARSANCLCMHCKMTGPDTSGIVFPARNGSSRWCSTPLISLEVRYAMSDADEGCGGPSGMFKLLSCLRQDRCSALFYWSVRRERCLVLRKGIPGRVDPVEGARSHHHEGVVSIRLCICCAMPGTDISYVDPCLGVYALPAAPRFRLPYATRPPRDVQNRPDSPSFVSSYALATPLLVVTSRTLVPQAA